MGKLEKTLKAYESYRDICKSNFPNRLEFYAHEEIHARNAVTRPNFKGDGHAPTRVPKDLPALQIVGSVKWHPNKVVHISAEMFLRASEKEMRATCLDPADHWQTQLPKCLNDQQPIWYDGILSRKANISWRELRKEVIAHFDTPEQMLNGCLHVLDLRQKNESAANFMQRYLQKAIEIGIEADTRILIPHMIRGVKNAKTAGDFLLARYGKRFNKIPLQDAVNFLSSFQLDDEQKRDREKDSHTTTRFSKPIKKPRITSSKLEHQKGPCTYCKRPYTEGHRCEEYRIAKAAKAAKEKQRIARSAKNDAMDLAALNDALLCKPKL